jgi:hypothetical protein
MADPFRKFREPCHELARIYFLKEAIWAAMSSAAVRLNGSGIFGYGFRWPPWGRVKTCKSGFPEPKPYAIVYTVTKFI